MSSDAVVSFEAVTKHFAGKSAVDDLTFQVGGGRIVGLLGPNGAGKTTSLRIALGLCAPTAGRATVFGQPYSSLPQAGRRIGVTMDGIGTVRGATGRREAQIWARGLGISRARVDAVLDLVELSDHARRPVATYSAGMRQRLALAVALLPDPELLVLDEPANGLDPEGIRWMRRLFRRFADEGRTVVLSTHILSELEHSVDDVVVLDRSLRFTGTYDEFARSGHESVEDRYFSLVGERRREAVGHA